MDVQPEGNFPISFALKLLYVPQVPKKYDGLSPIVKTYVNDYFGCIQHPIEDMGVSYHTKLEPHWPIKPIENYGEKKGVLVTIVNCI
jgi:hypothetical protein